MDFWGMEEKLGVKESFMALMGEMEPPADFNEDAQDWRLDASISFIHSCCI
jgi:hypothetical protein